MKRQKQAGKFSRLRNSKGQALTLPAVLLSVMVIGAIGIFGFEIARVQSAREQLRSAVEAAALSGAASLASFQGEDGSQWHTQGISAARAIFARNEIFGVALNNIEGSGTPLPGQTLLEFKFIDPTTKLPVSFGNVNGKIMEITARYGYTPMFSLLAPMIPLETKASGGLGELDVALCFDCSGSMEFETLTTEVRRKWDPVAGRIDYQITRNGKGGSGMTGAMRPQELSAVNAALRGATDSNSPPGNFPPGVAVDSGFTDVVVNLDENVSFAGFSEGGFDFPNVAALVEASRGNLENSTVFENSMANTTLSGVVTPKPGYQAKYFELARKHTHPFAEAEEAAKNFYRLMDRNTKAHFAFVGFQGIIGANPSTTFNDANVSTTYAAGGNSNFPLPAIELNPTADASNFSECLNAVSQVVPKGSTNIGGSVERAIRMFQSGARPNARKAIIVFTDGEPTVGGPLSSQPRTNCQMAAQLARSRGIAVYTVGLALDPSLVTSQRQVLGDDVPTGMAFLAGNESKFFQVTSANQLNAAFTAIARHLTQLVQ